MHDKSEKVRRVSQLVVLSYFSLLESWILMILVMVGSGLLFDLAQLFCGKFLVLLLSNLYGGWQSVLLSKREHSLVATESSGGDSCLLYGLTISFYLLHSLGLLLSSFGLMV